MMSPFRVLLVCTGNVCRSAAGQLLLTAHLREALGERACESIEVVSAGTAGLQGKPIHPATGRVLAELGLDARDFRARKLTAGQLSAADLVLTAAVEHRLHIAAVSPDAAARAFTLREASRLLDTLPPVEGATVRERGPALVRALARRADEDWSSSRVEDDIADPLGAGDAAHARAVMETDLALRAIAAALVGRAEA